MFDSNLRIKNFKPVILTLFLIFSLLPYFAAGQQKEVVAQKGDGIYRLLTRYGLSYGEYKDAFIELNREKIGKKNSLIIGRKYKLPGSDKKESIKKVERTAAKTTHYKIFGKKYADVEITDSKLKGAVYYVVGGHGGPDPGAIGKYNNKQLCEDEYAYDVALRLARNLIQHEATVYLITRDPNDGIRDESYLTPDKDEKCYPNLTIPLNQIKRLHQRANAVNKLYTQNKKAFQRMIVLHVDSRSRSENIDVFFYHDKRSKTGKKTAAILQQTFQQKYNEHQPGRGYHGNVSTRNLYIVKSTYPVAVFIELGNINHRRDQQRFIIPDNRQALANWLAQGLITDFKTNK